MMKTKRKRTDQFLATAAALGLLVLACPSVCLGHPFHISLAEVEYNAASQRLEVSLKLHASDLERALQRARGRKVDIEAEDIGKEVEAYLDGHFYLVTSDALARREEDSSLEAGEDPIARSKSRWVGKELQATWIWLYFELELPAGADSQEAFGDYALVNTVLLDLIEDQINTVTVRSGVRRHALKMTRKSPWQRFPASWIEKE